ncbi:MAG: nucleotidyltransferase domain-containing protein [bacterium]|nr:nucleotidyltransferase domain-containing protein [bacterium]
MKTRIPIPREEVEKFCRKWNIAEFSLFGSILRDDFREDSDVDVLVTFAADTHWTLFDLVHMEDGLKEIFGRNVDLMIRESVERSENPIRRQAILSTAQRIYAAG